jgi:hypothetical protein
MYNPTITATDNYCVFCDTITPQHICTKCNDYCITVDEAVASGLMLAIAPANCTCDLCGAW